MFRDFADMDLLKNVPESIRFPYAKKAVDDSYTNQ